MARPGFAGAHRGFSGVTRVPYDGITGFVPDLYDTTDTPLGKVQDLRCRDCHANVPRQVELSETSPDHANHYCPLCAKPVPAPLKCEQCESEICPRCGTPLELADELGIG